MRLAKKINDSKLFNNHFDVSNQRNINFLVLHHIMAKSIDEAIALLKKHKVSSHYIIDENGEIFCIVKEDDIAYHAGTSYWNGKYDLNNESIGIEFMSSDPYIVGFSENQVKSGVGLCQNIIKKYQIEAVNVVGHSDIAYDKKTGFLNRKDDPSHMFPWKFFAQNNVGVPLDSKNIRRIIEIYQHITPEIHHHCEKIYSLKHALFEFGYKVDNLNKKSDEELQNIMIVFKRRFMPIYVTL